MSRKSDGIYDARQLGYPKMIILGLQHMFAMFGATVLVPALTGLSVSATLLFAGLGTLLFHFLTKGRVPAFLGSSFAFLAGYGAIAPNGEKELLPYACLGVACAGLLYLVLAGLIKVFGQHKVMRFFPPIVTGPIIIAIGLTLASSAIDNCKKNWGIAVIAILIVVICNIYGKGMIKIVPIIMGVFGSVAIAAILAAAFGHNVDGMIVLNHSDKWQLFSKDALDAIKDAKWIGLPFKKNDTIYYVFKDHDRKLIVDAIITIMPIAIATIVEHIGDISAISSTTGENYIDEPGLHRTLTGDGLATIAASLFGAPANTTYGENTGVLSLTKVYDPKVIRIAAFFAILLSFSPKFAAVITAIPGATIGGVSLVLYGMISAVGVRNVVENQVDFSKSRNIIIAALILGLSIGIKYSGTGAIEIDAGRLEISLSGLAVGAIIGIIFNAILPMDTDKDYTGLNKEITDDNKKTEKAEKA